MGRSADAGSAWIKPLQALYELAPTLGGLEAAKGVLTGRCKEGRIRARATSVVVDEYINVDALVTDPRGPRG